jgi:hypothetical protein
VDLLIGDYKMELICSKCQVPLTSENWSISTQKRGRKHCNRCLRDFANNNYQLHKYDVSQQNKIIRVNTRNEVLTYYGGRCEKCGESNYEVLSLDHIDGNGRKHRKKVLKGIDSGSGFFKWVLKNRPNNIRLLCYNCNCQINMNKIEICAKYNDGCQYCGEERMHQRHSCRKCKQIMKRNRDIDLKLEAFSYYGCKCANCDINDIRFLTIDHINDDGAEHRRQIGPHIIPWLHKNKYPVGFQILCFNCNYLKRNRNC